MATNWTNPLQGVKERRLSTDFCHLRIHYLANTARRGDWSDRYAVFYFGKDSPRWRREQEIDYKAYKGQRMWPMLSAKEHDLQVDVEEWTKFRVIDQGIRHPTVCLWIAVNARGDRHVYKEYYATDRSIATNCRAILSLSEGESISGTFIDPSTRKRTSDTLKTEMDIYSENGIYCMPADNSFAGHDTVGACATSTIARNAIRTGILPKWLIDLKATQDHLLVLAQKPALTFDLRFTHRCFEECCNFRWQETKGDLSQKAEIEKPMDKDDDGPDCVRYGCQSTLYYKRLPTAGIKLLSFKRASDFVKAGKEKMNIRRAYV